MTDGREMRYVQAPGVNFRKVDEDAFLIDPKSGTIHHLNQTGAAIWRQLAEPAGAGELLALLRAAFPEAPPARLKHDLDALLSALEAEKLIVAAPEP